jgi:hypothetical protein
VYKPLCAVRLFYGGGFMDRFGRGPSLPFRPPSGPKVDQVMLKNEVRLPREDEKPGEKVLPRDLQPSQSVRFVTNEVRLHALFERTRPSGSSRTAQFRIGVLYHRDRWHTSAPIREVVVSDPEEPLP